MIEKSGCKLCRRGDRGVKARARTPVRYIIRSPRAPELAEAASAVRILVRAAASNGGCQVEPDADDRTVHHRLHDHSSANTVSVTFR